MIHWPSYSGLAVFAGAWLTDDLTAFGGTGPGSRVREVDGDVVEACSRQLRSDIRIAPQRSEHVIPALPYCVAVVNPGRR